MFTPTSAVQAHFPHKLMRDYPNHAKLFSMPRWPVMKPLKGLVRRFLKPERKTFARDAQK